MIPLVIFLLALPAHAAPAYATRDIEGWTVHIRRDFPKADQPGVEKTLASIRRQLKLVKTRIPEPALSQLKTIEIYVSPPYAGFPEGGAFHPNAGWLLEHGRDPAMAGHVELMLTRIVEKENDREPMFLLHELAHAYHDRFLGHDDPDIASAYAQALKSGVYDRVERRNWPGQPVTKDRAYALTNADEYFAETTEAFFGRNDFFPFDRKQLAKADPAGTDLMRAKWGLR